MSLEEPLAHQLVKGAAMATMLRIGQHVINLDQVTHIDNLLPSVTVWFGERSMRFNGSDAT